MGFPHRRRLVTILDVGVMASGTPPIEVPVTGLGVWYKADTIAGADGALVPAWADSGPNHFDLSAAGGNQPTIQTNERNGQPVVRFDGVDDYMHTASILGSFLAGPTAQTVFIVQMQHPTDSQSTTYNWDPLGNGANMLGAHLKYTDNVLYYDTGPATGTGRLTATAPEPWKGTWHVIEMVRDGTTSSSFTIEGNPVSITLQPAASFNPAQSAVLLIAEHGGGLGTNIFQGDIAEFIMFNRTLDAAERTQVRNYLKQKWGIAQNKLKLNPSGTGYLLLSPSRNDRLALN